jgi:hypothetical protein
MADKSIDEQIAEEYYYHFLPADRRLACGDGREARVGAAVARIGREKMSGRAGRRGR